MSDKRKVTILGAGLVGSVLAVLLRKRGHAVRIYERRPDMRRANVAAGRSINLAMSERGWRALELAGIREAIEAIAIPMPGRFLHQEDGSAAFQAYGSHGEAIYSVSRGELNKKLMDQAEAHGAEIFFNQRCTHVDVPSNTIYLQGEDGAVVEQPCDLLFGADGAFSSLRTAYSFMDRTDFQQFYIAHGYKELLIPAGPENSWLMEKNALHIWPRHNFMLIALPNLDGSFTCTLFFPFEGEPSFESLQTEEQILSFFNQYLPDAVPLMPTLLDDFKHNPVSSLVTTKIYPWKYQDRSCLIGDAAHALVPFYGQGLNAGLEDCTILDGLMDAHKDDWSSIFKAYETARKPNGDAVADLALINFIEMRDKVADPDFLMRKKVEKELVKRYPGEFLSVYEMVSFSHTPYDHALKSMQAQDELWEKIRAKGDYFEHIASADYQHWLDGALAEYNDGLRKVLAEATPV